MIQTRQIVLDGTNRRDQTRASNGRIMKDIQKWNSTGKRKPSSLQKKCLLALAMMEVIRTTLGNHKYQFNGKVYRQLSGGPIGDNLTNLASKLVKFTFSSRYRAKLVNLQVSKNTTFYV